ncbi:ATP-dependent DNA helicase Q4-like [Branchiostoma floridae x Branchiostoma japonicum]
MERLGTLKQRLKSWEAEFVSENSRKPNKDDIAAAPQDIKDTYKEYYSLKKKQEKEKVDDVWGSSLNKPATPDHVEETRTQPKVSLVETYSRKLKQRSALMSVKSMPTSLKSKVTKDDSKAKENPSSQGKIPSLRTPSKTAQRVTTQDGDTSGVLDDTCQEDDSETGETGEATCFLRTPKMVRNKTPLTTRPGMSCNVPFGQQNAKLRNRFDTAWLQRCAKGAGGDYAATFEPDTPESKKSAQATVNHLEIPKDTETFTDRCTPESDIKEFNSLSCDISETNRSSSCSQPSFVASESVISTFASQKTSTPCGESKKWTKHGSQDYSLASKATERGSLEFDDMEVDQIHADTAPKISPTVSVSKSETMIRTPRTKNVSNSNKSEGKEVVGARKKRKVEELEEELPEVRDEEDSPVRKPAPRKRRKVSTGAEAQETSSKKKPGRKQGKKSDLYEFDGDMEEGKERGAEGGMTDESGEKQKSLEDLIEEDEEKEVKKEGNMKKRFSAPRPSGSSAGASRKDNFVRLNMKRKTYKRKGGQMTGGKYRRMMWKQRMKGRDQSQDVCFKCGQQGHWATKCTANGKVSQRAKDDWTSDPEMEGGEEGETEASPFPSLEDAAMMAVGRRPSSAGRKPEQSEAASAPDSQTAESPAEPQPAEEFVSLPAPAYEPPPPPPPMEPLYPPAEDGELQVSTKEVKKALGELGYKEFRSGQEEAVSRILSGMSTLVVLSTGAGKSLCYQLPAYMYAKRSKCITLVISPLVSLMDDQVTGLPSKLKAACLHSNMTQKQRENVVNLILEGKVHLLLISPEALVGGGGYGTGCLPGVNRLPPIAFACIDEAHCVSEWSHNFRPSYLRLCKVLRERYGVQCLLGLTATATRSTAASVAEHLGIPAADGATVRGAAVPPNLHLSVSCDKYRDQSLVSLLKGRRFVELDSIIIYCTRREETERIAALVRTCLPFTPPSAQDSTEGKGKKKSKEKGPPQVKWLADCYHAGKSAAQRRQIQKRFMSGELRIVVATVAFGMGLDKSDVRAIIHYNMPKSFENYVQEIGRAGRDGKPSHCHLFLNADGSDLCELRRHTYGNSVDRTTVKKLLRKVFPRCRCREKLRQQRERERAAQVQEPEFEEDGIDYAMLSEDANTPAQVSTGLDNDQNTASAVCNHETADSSEAPLPCSCPGHVVAVPVEAAVQALDMTEEGIATLLCYLELHQRKWIEVLQPIRAFCTIQFYGGPGLLRQLARTNPIIAAAVAMGRKKGVDHSTSNRLEFNVVELADRMGWDLEPVRRDIRALKWKRTNTGGYQRTGLLAEFTDVSFLLRAPGDLTDDQLDEVSDFLYGRVESQERTELRQLKAVFQALTDVSHDEFWHCAEEVDQGRSEQLKVTLREYFEKEPTLNVSSDSCGEEEEEQVPLKNEGQVRADIRSFVCLHHDRNFTGRAIARIFHGITSPCYPAQVWGRDRRYWRSHLDVDFNQLRRLAVEELVRIRM